MKWLNSLTGGYKSSAKVVNDTLILSLPGAKSPVVWRMDLGQIKAASFEVQEKEGVFGLVMKIPAGETQQIAPFDNRDGAVEALMSASRAMEQAQTMVKNAANDKGGNGTTSFPPVRRKPGSFLTGVFGVVLLLALLYGLTQMGPRQASSIGFQATGGTGAGTSAAPAQNAGGVPMSADDFLKGR